MNNEDHDVLTLVLIYRRWNTAKLTTAPQPQISILCSHTINTTAHTDNNMEREGDREREPDACELLVVRGSGSGGGGDWCVFCLNAAISK